MMVLTKILRFVRTLYIRELDVYDFEPSIVYLVLYVWTVLVELSFQVMVLSHLVVHVMYIGSETSMRP